jgi:peptidoglycan/LPS O-acetylase OafA/YrhL
VTGARHVDILRYLGTRTLPIYLFHTFPLAVVATVLGAMSFEPAPGVAEVLPIALAAVAIGLSLAAYSLLRTVPGTYTRRPS